MPGPCNGAALDSLAKSTATLSTFEKVNRVIDDYTAKAKEEPEPVNI
jgi:hypothetical protein